MTQPQPKPPSLQSEVITQIFAAIGEGDRKYISEFIDDLGAQNASLDINAHISDAWAGFLYGMQYFTNLSPKAARFYKKIPLDPSLYDKGKELVAATKELERDTMRLKQGLILLLRDCESMQDIRDALPNAARMVVPELNQYERTREVAYTLRDKPLLFDQYGETERLFQYYLSSRMLD